MTKVIQASIQHCNGGFKCTIYDLGKREDYIYMEWTVLNSNKSITKIIKNKTIFVASSIHIPQLKKENACKKFGISFTNDIEKADVVVGNSNVLNRMLFKAYRKTYNYKELINVLTEIETKSGLKNLSSDTILSPTDDMFIFNPIMVAIDNTLKVYVKNTPSIERITYIPNGHIQFYDAINNRTKVSDIEFLNLLSEESIILTKADYKRLSGMLNSKDTDNANLALEIMCNSNYKKSYDVLTLLLTKHIVNLKALKNWKSVNSKSFRIAMKDVCVTLIKDDITTFYSIKNLLQTKKCFTEFAANELAKLLLEKTLFRPNSKPNCVIKTSLIKFNNNKNNK